MAEPDRTDQKRRRAAERAEERAKRVAGGGLQLEKLAVPLLPGGFDAVSLPIEAVPGPEAFIHSERNDWLFPVGAGKTFGAEGSLPRRQNTPGWIYLRTDHQLRARVRFVGVTRRQIRQEHIPSEDGKCHDRGAGFVLEVDPTTWTLLDEPVTLTDAEQGNGYRYYDIDEDSTPTFRLAT